MKRSDGVGERLSSCKERRGTMLNVSLDDLRWWAEEYVRDRTDRDVLISIHVTTDLDKVKANVQREYKEDGEFDIVISGRLKFKDLIEAVAHEAAHIVLPEEMEHGEVWEKEKDKIKKYLLDKVEVE